MRASNAGIWLGVLVLLAVVASALLAAGARPATPASGLIAFTRSDGIYAMRPDGSGVRLLLRLTGHGAGASGLAWSPDGSKLAFAGGGVGSNCNWLGCGAVASGIWLVDANGEHPGRLLSGVASSPTWSPDGRRIAFGWVFDIWVVNTDGSGKRHLRTNGGFPAAVDWSPAGGKIAFSFFSMAPAVYVMNTSGRNVRTLVPPGSSPSWSPDGRRIAFTYWNGDGTTALSVMSANGRNVRKLVPGSWAGAAFSPSWSPDGRRIAFVRGRDDKSEIYVMNADGTEVRRLTKNNVADGSPAWQPAARQSRATNQRS